MASAPNSQIRTIFITGLQNVHAVEQQALALIDRQLDRLVRYPEIAERLRAHRIETEAQIRRLDDILAALGTRSSSLKDMALSFMGNLAAMGHVVAPDEVLKNQFVNAAFENYEIASYTSLIALADTGAFPSASALLGETLREEVAMAAWVQDSLPDLTRKYAGLRTGGGGASH
ncbi:ferritin-like domain-containing protein [Sphingosinicella sp. BN140058]|uniref:ferritin-like domain-containing protein n=1 Tax=Sphingosinicella sp. BN140058 TaxID=1892855 RepID=UPI00101069CD|nr:ferritin-like domain-containing protein [Sphingosinicella sp. BN140058]QAY79298.1 ferritin-like domain-containing protein [Sphingosinicella sp. BN140058]